MYTTSTQKKNWTFASQEEIAQMREKANLAYKEQWASMTQEDEKDGFLSTEEEDQLLRVVADTGIKFGDQFRPPLWPSIRWTAFAYFKRFYLRESAMEYSPKIVMTTCYYLAAKVDEFYVAISEFVQNLRMGTAEQNMQRILAMEPEIMRNLNYELTVHCPFRPFEGHLVEMKTRMLLLNFELDSLRPPAERFFKKCLLGDAILLFPPSQIALAAIKSALDSLDKSPELLKEFLMKMMGVEDQWEGNNDMATVNKLIARLDEIIAYVEQSAGDQDGGASLQSRMLSWSELLRVLEERKANDPNRVIPKEDPVDSDDED